MESSPASLRPLTMDELWALERVAAPAVSPDGRRIAFNVTRFSKEENKGTPHLFLVSSDGKTPPRQLTWSEGSHTKPRWSADGRFLGFLKKTGQNPPQLFRLDMEGGEAEPLTELPVGVRDFYWFPDGRRIAFVAPTFPGLDDDFEKVEERVKELKEDKTQARISDRRLLRYWDRYRTDGAVPHIFELDLPTREIRDLLPGHDALMGFRIFSWDLSPEGNEIIFAANSTDPPWQELRFDLYLIDVEQRSTRNLTEHLDGWSDAPYYTPDGRHLLFARTLRPQNSADFSRLARYDRASGEVCDLTAGGADSAWDGEPLRWRTSQDGHTIVFQALHHGRSNLYTLPIEGGTPSLLVKGGYASQFEVAPQDEVFFMLESFCAPGVLASVPLTGGEPTWLTQLNQEQLESLDIPQVERVTFEGADGDPVEMWVMHPPDFDPQKKWPLVLLIHGGPHSAWHDSFHYRWNAALFATQGWVVAAVNFHGSTGFGQAFAESIVGNHPEKPFIDLMNATDHLLDRGYIDAARMAAAGGSFGGFMTSWILGHTDRFAALVNHAGVYDLMAQFASDYTWSRENSYGAAPWEDPEEIDKASPSRFAKFFTTPTLILHGELDFRVPVTQAINLHHVLTGKGVPSRIVIFPKENHWVLKPQAAEIWWREVSEWIEKYIGKGPSDQD